MNHRAMRWVIALLAIAITSGVSHFLVSWLHIRTGIVSHRLYGDRNAKPFVYLAGSSLTNAGLALDRVAAALGHGIETWFVAGGSPPEWEPFQTLAPDARMTLIGISAYDLNEEFLCDFRSQIVPLRQSVRDLAATRSNWHIIKNVVSQYPLKFLRTFFPTAGRSEGVMGGLKEELQKSLRPWSALGSDPGPKLPPLDGAAADADANRRISDWSPGYLLRSLEEMRRACGNRHSYDGIKKLALLRMLEQGRRQGRVIVVVLPVSGPYEKEFLTAETARMFENALHAAQIAVPEAMWVRLDQIPQLSSSEYYYELVHMNIFGQQIATDALLKELKRIAPKS